MEAKRRMVAAKFEEASGGGPGSAWESLSFLSLSQHQPGGSPEGGEALPDFKTGLS